MTIKELIEELQALVAEDSYREDMQVLIGHNFDEIAAVGVTCGPHNLAVCQLSDGMV